MKLSEIINIGNKLEKRLNAVGIYDYDSLIKLGSREAFRLLYRAEGDTCLNSLCALEGAIRGIRWHDLPEEIKKDLKNFYNLSKE